MYVCPYVCIGVYFVADAFLIFLLFFFFFLAARYNAKDLDLNRNFPDFFKENTAEIQPETRAVMNWIRDTHFVLSANLHGSGVVVTYPFDSYTGGVQIGHNGLEEGESWDGGGGGDRAWRLQEYNEKKNLR